MVLQLLEGTKSSQKVQPTVALKEFRTC